MRKEELLGRWNQVRGKVRQRWGKLTEDELNQVQGNWDMLVGKIQEKYGMAREQVEEELRKM
mgnify:CR=1 FL=1